MHISKIAMISSILITANAIAQEKKIQRSDLPPAVERTVSAAQNPGVTIRGFSQETEKGQTYYEAETTVNGHSKDLLMDAHGAIVEVEEQVDFDSLQPSVKDGLQAKAGTAKILKVESITKKNRLVAYEAVVQTRGQKKEVQVDPDGKPLDHEE